MALFSLCHLYASPLQGTVIKTTERPSFLYLLLKNLLTGTVEEEGAQ